MAALFRELKELMQKAVLESRGDLHPR
ncbi:hypothetical protein MRX96_011013 [Rhipicephalus microplus]